MTGGVLYGPNDQVLVDTTLDGVREQLLASLTSGVMVLLQAHSASVEARLHDGLSPDQRRTCMEHLAKVNDLLEDLLHGGTLLFGAGGDDGR